ncbi:unnamed protein product [Plasmodium vivax]|uniref:(malaria parasite P. vivax) hypothetical protein n=1 Tax=Plasmodium vivax TaxID=5855 RepID=A0A8S4H569_PLAVI|nr:unnamed protein product [Plasmodium vivax]
MYDNFNQNVNGSEYNEILNGCDTGRMFQKPDMQKYKNICKKLSLNLLLLAKGDYKYDDFFKYCDMLYIWMDFEINKQGLTNSIIEEIFKLSIQMIKKKFNKESCSYFSFNEKLQEPEKLIKLRIFQYNTSTIKNILNNINHPDNCSCLEYVYECINIYYDMNNKFCAKPEDINITYKGTCDILKNFNSNYSSYIRNVKEEFYKLPFLSDTATTTTHTPTDTHLTRCSANMQNRVLDSGSADQSSSPKQISISTALSTMAGIPPFLALIYKFTPVGTWFRSKYRKGADVIKNLDEDIEKELYYPRPENENINSSHARYNVAYEPV